MEQKYKNKYHPVLVSFSVDGETEKQNKTRKQALSMFIVPVLLTSDPCLLEIISQSPEDFAYNLYNPTLDKQAQKMDGRT